jgi:small GTP-binding protein
MSRSFKVLIAGAFNAGKSEFVRTASQIPVVSTERRISDDLAEVKEETTVAMDYGQATVRGDLFHLFGTPGQSRFDFMWDILGRDSDALLVLVDSTDRSTLTTARRLLRQLRRKSKIPFLVVATKQDGRRPMTPDEIASGLKIEATSVVACDARQKESVIAVLSHLSTLLR